MRKIKFISIFILLSNTISFCYGWGKQGHQIIVEVAKNYVSKNIQDSVQKYLGNMTWESASTWMDEMRSNSQYDYIKTWHYLDMEKGTKYNDTIANGNNVVNQLQLAINNLKNRAKLTKEEINFNLKVLFHLIGDIHQPLHVGYGVDKGGNTIKVTFNGKPTNLHHVWDTDIIEYKNITLKDIRDLLSKTSERRLKEISNVSIVECMEQNRKLLAPVYSYSNIITDDYINKSEPLIEEQLLFAGIRLGKILNDVFNK